MSDLLEPSHVAVALLVFSALTLFWLISWRRRRGAAIPLRDFADFRQVQEALGRAAESGRPVHIALGSGVLGTSETITSLAGLRVVQALVDAAVAYDAAPVITVGDPTLIPLAQDVLRRGYERKTMQALYDPVQVRFVAPSPLAFAAGANPVGAPECTTAHVTAGAYGLEVSLIADSSTRRKVGQWAAVDSPQAIGALYPATPRLAMGEELYALGAQMTDKEKFSNSLVAQDIVRVAVAVTVLGASVLALLGR